LNNIKKYMNEFNKINADINQDLSSDSNASVHVMPEKFRFSDSSGNTKKVGLFIIIIGALFLIVASISLYFYLFREKSKDQVEEVKEIEEIIEIPEVTIDVEKQESNEIVLLEEVSHIDAEDINKEIEVSEPAIIFISAEDDDIDGLSNKEEELLGCDLDNADSDGDGYNDLSELSNLYNPAGQGELKDNENISLYSNSSFGYSLLYASEWGISNVAGDESIIFTLDDDSFSQVISQKNTYKESIEGWYYRNFEAEIDPERKITLENWQGVKSEDGLIVYLSDNALNNIITMTYIPGQDNTLDYINIFEMMINSLVISN